MSKVNVSKTWRFTGKSRRHEITLQHNTLSGKQLLTVNGEVLHKTNWKYKLTGNMVSSPQTADSNNMIRARDALP
jgi:hypothetical protein